MKKTDMYLLLKFFERTSREHIPLIHLRFANDNANFNKLKKHIFFSLENP